MRLTYHKDVQADVQQALRHYETLSPQLADALWRELHLYLQRIAENPIGFHYEKHPYRRANLKRFPYTVLYRVFDDHVKIMVFRHIKRKPSFGAQRR